MQKDVPIQFESKTYSCKLESKDSQELKIEISEEMFLKFKGNTNLKNIYEQIRAFDDYTMEEVFTAMKDLPKEDFNLKKEYDKIKLDIKFKIMKKEKHLIIDLIEVKESNESIIQNLMKINKKNEERLEALEKELLELKNNKEKKLDVKATQPICTSDFTEKDVNLNIKGSSLLVLNDGRISIGTKEAGTYISDPNNFQECMHIPKWGPMQTQIKMKKGILLISHHTHVGVINLSKNEYNFKAIIDCHSFNPILYTEALESDYIAVFVKYSQYVSIYKLYDDYEKSYKEHDIKLDNESSYCQLILNLNSKEMLYIISTDSHYPIKKSVFYDYKNNKEIKSISIYVDVENKAITKINDNLIAASESTKITLIDIKQHKVAKLFDINKNIFCLYPIEEKYLIISVIDDESEKNFLQKYEINDEGTDLKLIKEKKDMKVDSFVKTIGSLNDGNFILLSYLGSVQLISKSLL